MAEPTLSLATIRKSNPEDDTGNKILRGLDSAKCKHVLAKMVKVPLQLHEVLYEAGETISECYFISSGLISMVSVQPDGKSVEVGLIGNEGFVGLPVIVGYTTGSTRMVVQGNGTALKCSVTTLRDLIHSCPELELLLHRYTQQLGMQVTQVAVCNRLHKVGERLVRWILMYQDRLMRDELPLTQDFVSQMLGTRRASVTVAAGILQRAGLISYNRGKLKILNRRGLESAACDCYGVVQAQLKEWDKQTAD